MAESPAEPPDSSRSRNPELKQYPSYFKSRQDQELIRLALHQNAFFTCLDEEQIQRLVATAVLQTYEPKQIVILEGCVDKDNDDDNVRETMERLRKRTSQRKDIRPSRIDVQDDTSKDEKLPVGPPSVDDEESPVSVDKSERVTEEEEEAVGEQKDSALRKEGASPAKDESEPSSAVRSSDGDDHANDSVDPGSHSENVNDLPHPPLDQSVSSAVSDVPAPAHSPSYNRFFQHRDDDSAFPPPPQSNAKRALYIVRKGHAEVWYKSTELNPASLGPGTLFGEGGFLFGRQHSASVLAGSSEPLECYVVDIGTFRDYVLPSRNMSQLFHKYATQTDENGTPYMSMSEFVEACEPPDATAAAPDPLVGLRIADTYQILQRHGRDNDAPRIYLADFCLFHLLMARPDPEVDIAFLLMDQHQTGQISLPDLQQFIEPVFPNADLRTEFFQRYFGKNGDRSIRQMHFSQFLMDLQREMGEQAFLRAVTETGAPEGYLAPDDFVHVLKTSCGWRLPEGVAKRLEDVYCHGPVEESGAVPLAKSVADSVHSDSEHRENRSNRYFAYGDFLAFQDVLTNLPGICSLIDRCQEIKRGPVSADDFKMANRVMGLGGRLSRRQVDIIFQLFDLDQDGYVSHDDTVSICGVDFAQILVAKKGREGKLTFAPAPEYRHEEVDVDADEEMRPGQLDAEQVASYIQYGSLMSISSALGVSLLYPLDLLKTRLMNMRVGVDGKVNYNQLFQQILRTEGVVGLYRGLLPALLGVAPEKAIKLQVNGLVRQAFSSNNESNDQKLSLAVEAFAGACAGACQLLVTNPTEITKIRFQMQSETARLMRANGLTPVSDKPSLRSIVHELGLPGMYRGASACLLRDIPFGAIYFSAYSACKEFLATINDRAGKPSLSDLLIAGTLAGVPAAFLTTPADVVKTRIQTVTPPGESAYGGIVDCARKIYEKEGALTFFRGATARVLRIAPQFGISLLAYEKLSDWLGLGDAFRPPTNVPVDVDDYYTAFPARAIQPKAREIAGWVRNFGVYSSPTDVREDPKKR